jgi:rod shape-determining protein MreD
VNAALPQLAIRLIVIGVAVVILQIAAVSQITLFGTNADVVPLVVASVGLLCGSVTGAVFGFFAGLFVDTALVQTLGITSMAYLVAGYGAGRIRELRDPQAALTPMAVGAAATAVVSVGFSLMQFLLGFDAPVSFLLVRETIATIVLNTLLSIPVYAATRRLLLPALPEDPRRRRRRAQTSGGLSPLMRA